MEITMRWHRLLRALAFAGGLVLGLGAAIFIFSNLSPIDVHWRIPSAGGYVLNLSLKQVSIWVLAIVPLLVGAVAGYLYQTPARMHHVREALHHRHRVHELEHELKEMRTSLDRLLMMPEDGRPAIPAQIMATPIEHRAAESEDEPERDPRLPDEPAAVELLAAKPIKEEDDAAEAPAGAKAVKPRRRFFGGLKAEVAEIKLPEAIPATIVAAPRRNGRAANGKPKAAVKGAATPAAKPIRKAVPKKPR
jgi:hypothetical protein